MRYCFTTRPPRTATHTPPFFAALGFHMHYEGDPPHPNASQWAVQLLPVSKTQRYMDAGVAARFWSAVDSDLHVRKSYLLPRVKQPGAPDAAAVGGGRL